MASKRFTDTGKWNDPWFRALSPSAKLLWSWLVDHCDNTGVIEPDTALASFQIGDGIEEKHFTELGTRLQTLPNGKLWIPKFIRFQFGELMASSQVHCSIIKLIKSNQLDYPIPSISDVNGIGKGGHTPKDKDKDKRKVKVEEVRLACSKIGLPESDADWFFHKCEGNGWTNGGRPIKSWPHVISAWKAAGYMPSQKNGAGSPASASVTTIQNQTALTRVEDRIKFLRGQMPLHDAKHKTEWSELQVERKRLMGLLNFKA